MKVSLGIDRLQDNLDLFKNKRVGLITNPTGVNSRLRQTIDIMNHYTNLVLLFSPEHGVRGNIQAGEKLDTYIDSSTGLKVYSLYGKTKKPTKEMMDEIDVLCIDLQDVGSRFYTYIYTMAYAMQAASEHNVKFVVFDRPNLLGGDIVEGTILDLNFRSFIGYYPIVQRYSLTIGELALLFNKEYNINCDLEVIKMSKYYRDTHFSELGLDFIFPSPNIPTLDTVYCYNATCIFEGTNVSEGRGTTKPFEIIGAPWINSRELIELLNMHNLLGVKFRELYFTPTFSKYANTQCAGIELIITNYSKFEPVKTSFILLDVIRNLYSDSFSFNKPYKEGLHSMIDLNVGSDFISKHTLNIDEQLEKIKEDTSKFKSIIEKYYLYGYRGEYESR